MAGSSIHPIRSETDYERALGRIDTLINAPHGTREADDLHVLGILVEAYENEHRAMVPPEPIDAILVRLQDLGKTRKDLYAILGGRSRVSEILLRRRHLSLSMIRQLAVELHMPADILIRPYRLARRRKSTRHGRQARAG